LRQRNSFPQEITMKKPYALSVLLTVCLLAFGTGLALRAQAPHTSAQSLNGNWVNVDPDAPGITNIQVEGIVIRPFSGKRAWGSIPVEVNANGVLHGELNRGFSTVSFDVSLAPNGMLRLHDHRHYNDADGARPDNDSDNLFTRSDAPAPQQNPGSDGQPTSRDSSALPPPAVILHQLSASGTYPPPYPMPDIPTNLAQHLSAYQRDTLIPNCRQSADLNSHRGTSDCGSLASDLEVNRWARANGLHEVAKKLGLQIEIRSCSMGYLDDCVSYARALEHQNRQAEADIVWSTNECQADVFCKSHGTIVEVYQPEKRKSSNTLASVLGVVNQGLGVANDTLSDINADQEQRNAEQQQQAEDLVDRNNARRAQEAEQRRQQSSSTGNTSGSTSSEVDYCQGHHPVFHGCRGAISDATAKANYCHCP
jgi:hypothetical protein